MLVLTRREGEEIVIGGEVRVMVLGVFGDRVRLGFSGPPEIRVDRLEIHCRRDRAKLAELAPLAIPASPAQG